MDKGNWQKRRLKRTGREPRLFCEIETDNVREWLGEFGIPVEDVFFVLWQKTFVMLSNIFQEMEKKTNAEVMTMMWSTTFHDLYIAYDMGQDFQQQFERNAKKVTDAVNSIFRMI